MATVYSDTITTLRGEDSEKAKKVKAYQCGGRHRNASGVFTTAACNVGDVIQMCWIPFGARIIGGTVNAAALGSNTKIGVGTVGVNGTQAANTESLAANYASNAATLTQIPAAGIFPIEVTDKGGLYVTVVANNAAVTGKIECNIIYVID